MRAQGPSGAPTPRCEYAIFVQWGGNPILPATRVGDTPGMDRPLSESVSSGGYDVDVDAVASAMLTREPIRRVASGVLVPAEPLDLAASCVPEDGPATVGDAA